MCAQPAPAFSEFDQVGAVLHALPCRPGEDDLEQLLGGNALPQQVFGKTPDV